jgi:hypothetical protein
VAEGYVRPPILGVEPRSDRLAVWRFRIVLIIVFLALAAGAVLLVRWIVRGQNNEGSPSVTMRPPVTLLVR